MKSNLKNIEFQSEKSPAENHASKVNDHLIAMNYFKLHISLITNLLNRKVTAPWLYLKRKLKNSYFFLLPSIRLIKNSELFDKDYYLENYPDVKLSKTNPAWHYLVFGGYEGRNPSQSFDSKSYLELNPDVKATGMNPLFHFIKYGKTEGRNLEYLFNDGTLRRPKLTSRRRLENFSLISCFSDCLSFPTNFTIIVLSKWQEVDLKKTLQSISQQNYKHWNCFILQPSESSEQFPVKIPGKKIAIICDNNYEILSGVEQLFKHLEANKGFVGFLKEGEILRPDCLWKFYNGREENTGIIYSDHDKINEFDLRFDPWFTPNWSPDLLLSNNYIGGFYFASADLFLETYSTKISRAHLQQSIDISSAWRYGLLLNMSIKTKHIIRVPEILWSVSQQDNSSMADEYSAERSEVKLFLSQQGYDVQIENWQKGKIRRIKWALRREPLVSIIIPTTGILKYLKICIDSLLNRTSYNSFEIIILDNGKGMYPEGISYARSKGFNIIEINEDFNWSKFNNIGEKVANGELLLFLNDDIEVIEPQWLHELVSQACREDIGVVGSLLLYPTYAIQHAGVFLVDHGGGARHWFYKQFLSEDKYQNLDKCVREVSAITGACMMVKRTIFNEIGGFDENLSVVGNDVDFCLRALEAGYRNLWTPYSKVIHHESVTRKGKPFEKDEKIMWDRWGNLFMTGDNYYNPNLTLEKEDCSIIDSGCLYVKDYSSGNTSSKKTGNHLCEKSGTGFNNIAQHYTSGVNVISYIRAVMGVGEAARGNAKALKAANIPFGVYNFEKGNPSKMEDFSFQYREISELVFDINILHINADHTPFVVKNLGQDFFSEKYTIGFWTWELPEFPDKWLSSFDLVNEVWVPSPFVNSSISEKSPVPVITIPHVLCAVKNVDVKKISNRAYFNIPANSFVFLSMFDVHSIIERKNPLGSINAFKKAFKSDDFSVVLIIKVNNSNDDTLQLLDNAIGDYKNILIISKHLTRAEIESLMCSIDCYLSLHRSEGFGLGPAEAMARGKVVVLTNWSGNTAYMTHENCIPISYSMEQIGKDFGTYEKHQYWASPDIDEASYKMKSLLSSPEMVRQIGEKARLTISQNFSPEKVGKLMKDRIDRINLNL